MLDMKQGAFADLAGITQSAVSKIESGEMEPKARALIELARALRENPRARLKLVRFIFNAPKMDC